MNISNHFDFKFETFQDRILPNILEQDCYIIPVGNVNKIVQGERKS
jgi:hypothetical protein